MPFITEEIWQTLPEKVRAQGPGARGKGESIMVSTYPVADEKLINAEIEQDMQMVMDLILAITEHPRRDEHRAVHADQCESLK